MESSVPSSGRSPLHVPRSRTRSYYALANRLTSGRPPTKKALLAFAADFERLDFVPRVTKDRLRAWFGDDGPDAAAWRPAIERLRPGWFNTEDQDRAAGISRPGLPPRDRRGRPRTQKQQEQQQRQQRQGRSEDVALGLVGGAGGAWLRDRAAGASEGAETMMSDAGDVEEGGEEARRKMMSMGDAVQMGTTGVSSPFEGLLRYDDRCGRGGDGDGDDDDDDKTVSQEAGSSNLGEGRSTADDGMPRLDAGKAAARRPLASTPQRALPPVVTRRYPALRGTTVERYLLERAGEARRWVRSARVWAQNLALDHERDAALAAELRAFVADMRGAYDDSAAAVWVAEMCVGGRMGGHLGGGVIESREGDVEEVRRA